MVKISQRESTIINTFLKKGELQSSDVHNEMVAQGDDISLVTVKRTLSAMLKKKLLKTRGSGRSVSYEISTLGRIFANVNAKEYIAIEPDKRYGLRGYNFELFDSFPKEIFTEEETSALRKATAEYKEKIRDISPAIQKKELERLVIELSWKSSKIEGNTYTLLDTEDLIRKNKPAEGKSEEETRMILNHKDAFTFVYENKGIFKKPTRAGLERLHHLLIKGMNVGLGFRKSPIGVAGSIYRPLDNVYQITEAVESLFAAVNRAESSYGKSLLSLLGVSYIQPFEDGNKRTSRIMADAILLADERAPLSYRSVDEQEYREAVLAFYELNAVAPFKRIFVEQYEFAAKNYAVV